MMKNDKDSIKEITKMQEQDTTKTPSYLEKEETESMDTTQEESYQRLVRLMKSIKCMSAYNDKLEMYKQVAKQFSNLSGYKDADEHAEACKLLAKQTKKDIKKAIYKRAKKKKDAAKLPEDYQSAAEEFRKVSGYRDADDMALECDKLSSRIEQKAIRKRVMKFGIVMFCIVAVLAGASTSHAKYYLANVYRITGSYSSAIAGYQKLGAYKDCEERLAQCQYLYGLQAMEDKDYKSAEIAFAAAGDYKDSDELIIEIEKLTIKNSKVGDAVKIGKYKWEILETNDNQALLMKKSALPGMAYNDELGDITWEKSTLRQWLNSDFLEETFSELERNNIILMKIENHDNAEYGTDGGTDTQDYMFLLSAEETEQYKSLFPAFKSNSWLRSPGNSQSSAVFLSISGTVMNYGYVVTSEEMKVRPAMWFKLN